MTRVAVTAYTAASALGIGRAALLDSLRARRSGLARRRFKSATLDTWIGEVDGVDAHRLPEALAACECRNNRLAWIGINADGFAAAVLNARERYGADRVGVFVGTSTSGILDTEIAYRNRDPQTGALPKTFRYAQTHDTFSAGAFVRRALALRGPASVVSTACSSSAKVFAMAARMLDAGVIDAAVVGGVDSLCLTTLYGFNSLELLSHEICRPFDLHRHGLSLGEAAAFALLERDAERPSVWLLGSGESSDGYHMSSPHPEGAGAAEAMRAALNEAGVEPGDVDYLNLHGTGTPGNDAAEDRAVLEVFGPRLPCSSTKGATGHTLGAAGALEAVISIAALQAGFMPGGLNRTAPDPQLHCNYLDDGREARLSIVATNSFGFGGSNACLVFGAAA